MSSERPSPDLARVLPGRVLLDAMHVAVVATDLCGSIFYCNAAAQELYGYGRADLLGANVSEVLVAPDVHDQGIAIMGAVLAGQTWSGVFPVRCAGGRTVEVRITDSPLWDDGQVVGIVGVAEDLTAWREAVTGQEQVRAQMARMASVALALGSATTVDDLARIVIEHGVAVLDADGGVVSVRDDDADVVRLAVSDTVPGLAAPTHADLPLHSRLPAAYVARTGETVLLPTRASGIAWSPQLEAVYAATGRSAWATLPLRAGNRLLGSLAVAWTDERDFSASEVQLLEVFAAQCAQTLDRIQATEAQRRVTADAQRLSEALQRSLLTQPAQPEHVRVAVRYRPAVETAQVGGDWHDCFCTSAGDTVVVIGDVNGHDRTAAAAMGQVRNLVRGLAYDSADPPARLLSRLDEALRGLQLDTLATVLLGRAETSTPAGTTRPVRLTWSSAGHLPAVLRQADGTVEVLSAEPDLMLGVLPGTERHDHRRDLSAGALLLLYTDGLVERRGKSLDEGIAWLAGTLADAGGDGPQVLCDLLLEATAGTAQDDDTALLAMQT